MIMVRLVSKNARLCLSSRKLGSIMFGHKWFSISSEAFESIATDVFVFLYSSILGILESNATSVATESFSSFLLPYFFPPRFFSSSFPLLHFFTSQASKPTLWDIGQFNLLILRLNRGFPLQYSPQSNTLHFINWLFPLEFKILLLFIYTVLRNNTRKDISLTTRGARLIPFSNTDNVYKHIFVIWIFSLQCRCLYKAHLKLQSYFQNVCWWCV